MTPGRRRKITRIENSIYNFLMDRIAFTIALSIACCLFINCGKNKSVPKSAPDFSIATFDGHKGPLSSVSFTPDGKQLLSAGKDGKLILWDIQSRKQVWELSGGGSQLRAAAVSPDGRLTASGDDTGLLRIYDLSRHSLIQQVKADDISLLALSFDSTGEWIVTGGKDRKVKIWETATARLSGVFEGSFDRINAVALSADGKMVLAGSSGSGIRVWRRSDGKPQNSHFEYNGEIYCLLSDPGRSLVIAGGSVGDLAGKREGRVRIWRYPDAKELLTFAPHRLVTSSVAVAANGALIATASTVDPVIRLWNTDTGDSIRTLIGHSTGVNHIDISPDGALLASGGEDGTVKIWDLKSQPVSK